MSIRDTILLDVADKQAGMDLAPGSYLRGVEVVRIDALDGDRVSWSVPVTGERIESSRLAFLGRRVQPLDPPKPPAEMGGILDAVWAVVAEPRIPHAERLRLFGVSFAGILGSLTPGEAQLVNLWLMALRSEREPLPLVEV